MPQHRTRLMPATLLLALLVTTSSFAQSHGSLVVPRKASFGEVFLRGLLPDFLTRLWDSATPSGDLGCVIDPYGGRCATVASRPPLTSVSGDSGCDVDPYGRCATAASTNRGH
jgi:hypothetical protein